MRVRSLVPSLLLARIALPSRKTRLYSFDGDLGDNGMIGGTAVGIGVTTGVGNGVGTGGGVGDGGIVGSMSSGLIVGVGSTDTDEVGVCCGDRIVPIGGLPARLPSGLQLSNAIQRSDNPTRPNNFEESFIAEPPAYSEDDQRQRAHNADTTTAKM
jgi:hypothetical protein